MDRQQSDREDLLAEATALVERIELVLPGYAEPIVAGFRASDCASLFFGTDPVYQFNSQRQLRRAFVDGLLYKAECGRLVSLTRTQNVLAVELITRPAGRRRPRRVFWRQWQSILPPCGGANSIPAKSRSWGRCPRRPM